MRKCCLSNLAGKSIGVKVSDQATIKTNPNYGKRGAGAVITRKREKSLRTNRDGSCTETVAYITTINIKNNIFGREFAIRYAEREKRGQTMAGIGLNLAEGYFTGFVATESVLITIGTKSALGILYNQGSNIKDFFFCISGKLTGTYEEGGKIEDKYVIETTTFKDVHGYSRYKGTYSVWGKTRVQAYPSYCYENKEVTF
jgi:hypothetical protein